MLCSKLVASMFCKYECTRHQTDHNFHEAEECDRSLFVQAFIQNQGHLTNVLNPFYVLFTSVASLSLINIGFYFICVGSSKPFTDKYFDTFVSQMSRESVLENQTKFFNFFRFTISILIGNIFSKFNNICFPDIQYIGQNNCLCVEE